MCALCCHKRSTITVCGEFKEHYCCECIDTHTCGNDIIYSGHSELKPLKHRSERPWVPRKYFLNTCPQKRTHFGFLCHSVVTPAGTKMGGWAT